MAITYCRCPHCGEKLWWGALNKARLLAGAPAEFDWQCSHCSGALRVGVRMIPAFTVVEALRIVKAD